MDSHDQLIKGIREIYVFNSQDAQGPIEDYLETRLKNLTHQQQLSVLADLQSRFQKDSGDRYADPQIIGRIFELVLGKAVCQDDPASPELLERLSVSLNTIFDIVNQLIAVIDATLGQGQAGEETIRHVIGAHLESEGPLVPLEEHLGKIKKAFLTTQQAFKDAAFVTMQKTLKELDPDKISTDKAPSLKFGPLKKAEYFDMYELHYNKCKKWFESGRFMDDFLREFEKKCQKLFMSQEVIE